MKGISGLFSDSSEDCSINRNADITEGGPLEFHDYAWIAAAICTFIACVLSFYLIYKHCINYTSPNEQKFIIRLLLMVPIYALDSFVSFRLYYISVYFDLARDCYEAFVIQNFFCLMLEYQGGYHKIKESFAQRDNVKLVFPLNFITVKPKRGLLRTLNRLTLQYVIIEPLLSIVALILQSVSLYCHGNWNFSRGYIYITAILFVSVTLAMYALIMFFAITKKEMEEHKPFPKLLSVKAVIFLSFWQSIAVSGLVDINVIRATANWSTSNIADGVQNVLICGEMVIAAIVHIYVFSYEGYVIKKVRTPLFNSLGHAFNPVDIYKEIKYSFFPKTRKHIKTIKSEELAVHIGEGKTEVV